MLWQGNEPVLQRAKLSLNEENPFICETKEIRSFENNRQRIELEVKASKKLEKKVKQSNDT